jgi:hypothetical protein
MCFSGTLTVLRRQTIHLIRKGASCQSALFGSASRSLRGYWIRAHPCIHRSNPLLGVVTTRPQKGLGLWSCLLVAGFPVRSLC